MSQVITGILIAAAGSIVVGFGFSDGCSNEIIAKLTPFIGMLPGAVYAWVARFKKGDISPLGVRR